MSSVIAKPVSLARFVGVRAAEARYLYGLGALLRSARRRRPTFPALVEIQTVNRCNAACPMCPYPQTTARQPATTMSDETYGALLAQLAAEPEFQMLVLSCQNEPLVDDRLAHRARQFKQLMPDRHLEIVTNGSLLSGPRVAELYASFDLISVSVNAHSRATHRQVYGGLDYDTVRENLEHIATNPAWVDRTVLRFVRDQSNHAEYGPFKAYWNRRGFRVFGFDANSRLGAVAASRSRSTTSLAARLRRVFWSALGRVFMPHCTVPELTSYIRANGDVVLCFNDYSDGNILGSVQQQSIREIFNSAELDAVRARVRANNLRPDDVCLNCDLYRDGIWATF